MRLFKPAPGEMVDRQTILTLKVAHVETQKDVAEEEISVQKGGITRTVVANPTKINVHPFADELEMIRQHLLDKWIPTIQNDEEKTSAYDALYDSLYDVNSQLWELEDQARTLRDAPDHLNQTACYSAATVLFQITSLNDQRADIVKKINGLWGYDTQEKLY